MRSPRLFLLAAVASLLVGGPSLAGDADWPQWRGPHRDAHAAPQSLLQQWPESGPKLKWAFRDAGRGYSALAVVDGRAYTMGSRDSQTLVICLDAETGKSVWAQAIDRASVEEDYLHGWGGGPRSTPTVDGEHLYALSDLGTLACLKISDGNIVWSVSLVEQFGGEVPKWGYSESPLVDGDRVLVTPGGKQFLVGLDKRTGETVWGSQGYEGPAQYVSVLRHAVGDVVFYVTASRTGLVAFNAQSGEKLFESTVTGNETAVIPTPIVHENLLYHTSAYGAGNVLLRLSATGQGGVQAEQVYHHGTKSMENHHGGVVLVDGVIYGFTKTGGGGWMAQDLKSGEMLWSERLRSTRSGSICYADGRLYCYNDDDGTLLLVQPSRDGWQPRGELTLPEQTELDRGRGAIWAHPVVADQMLLIRDQDLIYAYDIAR